MYGVGKYYGSFDAQKIFLEIPAGALETKPLNIDWHLLLQRV